MNAFKRIMGVAAFGLMAGVAVPALSAGNRGDYDATKSRAEADYKAAVDRCKSLAGNPKDICEAEAKAARTRSTAMAEADYKNTPKAHADAMSDVADADYDVAKQRCDAKVGNEKDVCVKEAKAAQVKAKADAKASEKSSTARNDASSDKRDADYKVAMAKCDGYAGDAKNSCEKNAKAAYGK